MFLYRETEINLLEEDFIKPNSTLSFIFGRRKVGKTTLINNYIESKNALYLSCYETVSHILINSFKKSCDDFFELNDSTELNTLEDFIIYLSKQSFESKTIIVLENINDFLKIDKNFVPTFYKYWYKYLRSKNIQFIITSSFYSSSKEDTVIFKKANNVIKLNSLSFDFLKDRFPNKNTNDLIDIYCAFGTNPEYIKNYNIELDLFENIDKNFLSYKSTLFNEGMSLVKNDLSDAVTYCSILYSIALGNKKIGDIASFLNLKSSYITRYLQKLVDLMILSKSIPINDNPSKSKFGRYEFEDNFLKFWFCYIYPNQNVICSNKIKALNNYIKYDYKERLLHSAYKKYINEQLTLNVEDYIGFIPIKLGSWWNNKDTDIDFVAYNSKEIVFIDCRIENTDNGIHLDRLKVKSEIFNTPLNKNYMIIYKNGDNETKV